MERPSAGMVLATANPDKAEEVRSVLSAAFGRTVRLEPRPPELEPVEETGETLEENALLKARFVARATGRPAIADDTGLEVDALGGAPGVHSARYAGEGAKYADNVAKLLEALAHVPAEGRTARFRTVVAVVFPDGDEIVAEGTVDGSISLEPAGSGGFGYDPVFVPECGDGRSFAQLSPQEKHEISHRGRALRALAERLAARSKGPEGEGQRGSAPSAGVTEIAIGGLVLSVLWIFFLGSLVGLLLGLVARRRSSGDPLTASVFRRARRLATAAIALGALGLVVGVSLVAAQLVGVLSLQAICHPSPAGISCRLRL